MFPHSENRWRATAVIRMKLLKKISHFHRLLKIIVLENKMYPINMSGKTDEVTLSFTAYI